MPKTIKDILIEVVSLKAGLPLTKAEIEIYEQALAEIREILKEAEPEIKMPESFNFGNNNAIREYTANIEKRLG